MRKAAASLEVLLGRASGLPEDAMSMATVPVATVWIIVVYNRDKLITNNNGEQWLKIAI